jgi:lipopolysaccharide/colanic/teichoic acid biosynthesis glycosyltransferase
VLYFYYLKRVLETGMNDTSYILLAAIYISWIISSLLTKHFQIIDPKTTLWRLFSQHIKAYLVLFSLTASTIFMLNIEPHLRNDLLLGIMIYSGWSFLMTMFIYSDKIPYKTDEVYGAFLHAFEIKESDAFPDTLTAEPKAKLNDHKPKDPLLLDKLKFYYLKEYPQLFQFIERRVDLGSVNFDNMLIIRSADPYNIQVLPNDSLELFVNLHDINDLRRINRYFITVNEKLCDGGFYVGNFEAIKNRYARYLKKYPYLLANIFYFFDFLWKRVAPKIPVAQRFYFLLTKGKDRAISLAEGLGRLYFCGFEVIDIKEIDNMIYFVARKVKKPSSEYYNSYSFLFKMKRFGLHGKPIFVYKLRTMHPYSEYIQEFVYKHNQLEIGGKFKNDFRITSWGAWLRKLWIDELPMIFNLLRGDLKIFGVRPLSKHYLNLYSEEFRNRRANYKPGLVPPYYVHLPKTLEEIVRSEQTYLDEFDKNPFLTDIRYFFKAAYNIIIKKSRSS